MISGLTESLLTDDFQDLAVALGVIRRLQRKAVHYDPPFHNADHEEHQIGGADPFKLMTLMELRGMRSDIQGGLADIARDMRDGLADIAAAIRESRETGESGIED